MKELQELNAKFVRVYANLPVPERSQVVAVINDKPYSWDVAYAEISNNTELGNKILKKMKLVGIL
ncbi:MAG: hypothetical protein Q7K45_05975 [Nanoarchaeota archaeon]|nr:hypothetical protein [Nanoarchaeota archaeon]